MEILIKRLVARLEQEHLTLVVTDEAKRFIADEGYDSVYGARPLKRFIQSHAETPIARFIIKNNPQAGSTITLDLGENGLYLK